MLTNYLENKIIDWLFRGQTYTPPSQFYVALFTTATDDTGAGSEVSGGGYARVAVNRSLSDWAGTQGAGSTTASSGTSGQTSNNNTVTFPAPTGDWGQVSHFGVYDAATGGNCLIQGALTNPKNVNNGDPAPKFDPATLKLSFD